MRNATAYLIGSLIGMIAGFALGLWLGNPRPHDEAGQQREQPISIIAPTPVVDTLVRTEVRYLPRPRFPELTDTTQTIAKADTIMTADSVAVVIPITRRVYTDTVNYRAVVEGYEPRLMSLDIFPRQTPRKRWSIGPAVSLGYDGHRLTPTVGISLTYSIITF